MLLRITLPQLLHEPRTVLQHCTAKLCSALLAPELHALNLVLVLTGPNVLLGAPDTAQRHPQGAHQAHPKSLVSSHGGVMVSQQEEMPLMLSLYLRLSSQNPHFERHIDKHKVTLPALAHTFPAALSAGSDTCIWALCSLQSSQVAQQSQQLLSP